MDLIMGKTIAKNSICSEHKFLNQPKNHPSSILINTSIEIAERQKVGLMTVSTRAALAFIPNSIMRIARRIEKFKISIETFRFDEFHRNGPSLVYTDVALNQTRELKIRQFPLSE